MNIIILLTSKAFLRVKFIVLPLVSISLVVLFLTIFITPPKVYAATSPTLGEAGAYSVLAGSTVTNIGSTTTNGRVGVSAGTAITGFPPGIAGGGTHSNDASAIAAQADNLVTFGALNAGANADDNCVGGMLPDGTDLTATFPAGLGAGLYCSGGSFLLTGNLNLTGSGVWVFKTVSELITSPNSSITGGDPCNVWWRVGSSATLDTTTSFVGNIFALTSISINTGASLNGRALAQNGQVSLQGNTITTYCLGASSFGEFSSTSTTSTVCPTLNSGITAPIIIESRRIDADSVFISWGPYTGTDKFIVEYGLENGKWLYSTSVTGFSATINGLPAGQPIWVRIVATNGCSVGIYGLSKLVGGPLLPNTGFDPSKNNIPWYIFLGAFGILVPLVLIKRKYRF